MRLSLVLSLVLAGTGLASAADASAKGAAVYNKPGSCVTCHQATGAGLPGAFPPLAGSDWIYEDPAVLVKIVLHGLSGPIKVNDKKYASAMPGQGATLKDQEIADVLTYIRSSWGNTADAVPVALVTKVRAETADRKTMWTNKELRP